MLSPGAVGCDATPVLVVTTTLYEPGERRGVTNERESGPSTVNEAAWMPFIVTCSMVYTALVKPVPETAMTAVPSARIVSGVRLVIYGFGTTTESVAVLAWTGEPAVSINADSRQVPRHQAACHRQVRL